jgi:hypothetical protein
LFGDTDKDVCEWGEAEDELLGAEAIMDVSTCVCVWLLLSECSGGTEEREDRMRDIRCLSWSIITGSGMVIGTDVMVAGFTDDRAGVWSGVDTTGRVAGVFIGIGTGILGVLVL